MFLLLVLTASVLAAPLPAPLEDDPTALVGPALIEPHLPLPVALQTALAQREHSQAVALLRGMDTGELPGPAVGDHAFLLAWSLLRAERGVEAVDLIDKVRASRTAPESYKHLTIGEIHLANDEPEAAAEALSQVAEDAVIAPRALLQAAEALKAVGATRKAAEIHEQLIARSDPAEGSALALWALVEKQGRTNPKSRPMLRRLWMYYPLTSEGRRASDALGSHSPTSAERAVRANRLMELGAWREANGSVGHLLDKYPVGTEAGCMVRYAHGRALFKRNQVTAAAQVLKVVGEGCAEVDGDRGAKALYIAGKSLDRKKAWSEAAQVYEKLPILYPDHTMADDGYALGGIAWLEAGFPEKSRSLWERQVDAFPTGDLAGEGFWRLAWSDYQAGKPAEAIAWAERMVAEVPLSVDPVHGVGARYWAARWRIYPDVENPRSPNPDQEEVEAGIDGLLTLCTEHPASFYALFAAARLHELAPERLAALPEGRPARPAETWSVRKAFLDHPGTVHALGLARLRLANEAMAELATVGKHLTPSEMTIASQIHEMADPIVAHDRLHKFLLKYPPSTLGPDRDRILLQAHPDRYWNLVQEKTADFAFDPRIFHALVREESSFNPMVRSWAGARGLSQLMPATAKQVAGWMRIPYSSRKLHDPATNLAIGGRYLHHLFELFEGNAFLAIAAYNAGEGNVGKWTRRFGPVPTDEFVERIPFRETRGYVKRVLGTYQVYRTLYDPAPLFPDWQKSNHWSTDPGDRRDTVPK